MFKFSRIISVLALMACLSVPQASEAQGGCFVKEETVPICSVPELCGSNDLCCFEDHNHYCPVHNIYYCGCHCKVKLGQKFGNFDITDIYNQRWISTHMLGKPVVILTGHRSVKYEINKWAERFRREFIDTGMAYVVWVNNLSKSRYNEVRATVYSEWRAFEPPVPLLCDWDGIINRSLKVNYNYPNIIVLDGNGRLMMHEIHNYNPCIYASISDCIRRLCANPYPCDCTTPAVVAATELCAPVACMAPCGVRCDSN